ncbi:MAG: PQQ-binding-like beta-propeller repeat protein [Bacteroidetes bacterium]|nr:PQQ-binding-like beta-propeller repeat protein [Bacteroidota bacterium]MBS1648910.1 PQQ-binding-like beta-propeller repeat protein [Bacteroidota bacterium]
MKKIIPIALLSFISINVFAQKSPAMQQVWQVKLNHDFDESGTDDNILYGSNEKNYSVLRTSDGSVVWSSKFKDIYEKINKIDLQFEVFGANVLFLFDKKMGKDQLVVADLTTGKMLWHADKYQNIEESNQVFYVSELDAFGIITDKTLSMVKARTGEELWTTDKWNNPIANYLIDNTEGTITLINMPRSFISSLFKGFKNQLIKFDIKTGNVIWESTYSGVAQKKVITGERVVKLKTVGNKLFLQFNGLQVYDYTSGNPLWKAYFDATFDNVVGHIKGGGRVLKKGVYGCVADPIIDGDNVYVLDMKNRSEQYLKKYELSTGKLIWTSPEIKDAKVLPGLAKINDMIVIQVGGAVEVQAQTQKKVGDYTFTKWLKYYQNVGPYNVQAFKSSDGTQVWQSDKFKKGLTNITFEDNNLLVCSGKALYSLDYQSGKENYEIQLGDDDIALAQKIINSSNIGSNIVAKGNILVIGEKGISCHNSSNGSKIWAMRIKDAEFNGIYGKTAFYEKENGDVFAIDVNSGSATYCDARKNSKTTYSSDGNYLYLFEKKTVTKFKTN